MTKDKTKNRKLTDSQLKGIERVEEKYKSKIVIEKKEMNTYDKEIAKLCEKRKVHELKVTKLNREKNRKVSEIKDAERIRKYKDIDVKVGDVYDVTLNSNVPHTNSVNVYFGSYNIYTSNSISNIDMSIKVVGETPTQYRLRVTFSKSVNVYNPNVWTYNRTQSLDNIYCNMKKLNLKDFLSENSHQFKREVKLSNLID